MTKPPRTPPRELSLDEAMASLQVSEKTVRKYIKLKRLKAVKVGKRWFIDEASLELMRRVVQDEAPATSSQEQIAQARHATPAASTMAVHGLACYRPRTAETDVRVRVRVRRSVVQIDGEWAGVRAVVPVRPSEQRATALSRF